MKAKVDSYMKKQVSPQREICQKLREILLKTLPSVKEEMKWGVPTYADGKCHIAASKDHVNLGFSLDALQVEEQRQLLGSGKTMKHIEVRSLKELDENRIAELLKLALKN